MPEKIIVIKLNPQGEETWRYGGEVTERRENFVKLEAFFNRDDMPFMDTTLKRNDRFVETFYSDRWYNVFEIYDRDDGKLKGWYCNVTRPAQFADRRVSYEDLALDLWIAPNGKQTVLDEDEFAALDIEDETKARARQALDELKAVFAARLMF